MKTVRLRNQEKEIELKPLGSLFCVFMTQHPVQRSLKERLSNISLKHVGCITGHYLILYGNRFVLAFKLDALKSKSSSHLDFEK